MQCIVYMNVAYPHAFRVRNRLSQVVQPLLQLISAHTGFSAVTLLAGAPVEDGNGYVVGVVNHGTSSEAIPRNFRHWDPKGFDLVVDQWTQFLNATRGEYSMDAFESRANGRKYLSKSYPWDASNQR